MNPRALLLVALLAVGGAVIALGSFGPDLGAALQLGLQGDEGAGVPPSVEVLYPGEGAGVTGRLRIQGVARDNDTGIRDVHVRVDGGAWSSVSSVTRGAPVAAWLHELDVTSLEPGLHLLEFRADDGSLTSLPRALSIATHPGRAPPTLEVLSPRPGDGVRADRELTLRGVVAGAAGGANVLVRVDGEGFEATVHDAGSTAEWVATLPPGTFPQGPFEVVVTARDGEGLSAHPVSFQLAAADGGAPARVDILQPRPGDGVSRRGDTGCLDAPPCILVKGGIRGRADDVLVSLDGGDARPVAAWPGGETVLGPNGGVFQFALPLSDLYGGPHRLTIQAVHEGVRGAPATSDLHLAKDAELRLRSNVTATSTFEPVRIEAVWPSGLGANATWRVGHAPAGVGPAIELAFSRPGIHLVTARAVDAEGRVALAHAAVVALNRPPLALFDSDGRLVAGEPVRLNATSSRDLDGQVTAYRWSHQGVALTSWTGDPVLHHAFQLNGNVTMKLEVRDDLGAVSLIEKTLHVQNARPQLRVAEPTPRDPTIHRNVTLRAYAFDVESDPLLRWDLGDGHTATGPVVVHRYAAWGTYPVRVSARDAEGALTTAHLTVTVRNTPPVPAFVTAPVVPTTGEAVRFLDHSTDLDGEIVTWRWDFGDNTTARCAASGCLYEDAQGHTWNTTSPVPTHVFTRFGAHRVLLNVTDDAGDHAVLEQVVPALNVAPVANFTWTPLVPVAHHDLVRFDARARDLDGAVANWTWDFGGGARYACDDRGCRDAEGRPASTSDASGTHALHRFLRQGAHTVRLHVTDDGGDTTTHTANLLVLNAPPEVDLVLPDAAYAGIPVTLRVKAQDPDGHITRIQWDVDGDGQWDRRSEGQGQVSHNFTEPGTYPLHVQVTDTSNATAQDRATLVVYPPPRGTLPPRIRVYTPAPGEVLQGPLAATGRVEGVAEIARVEVQLRRDGWALDLGDGPWTPAEGRAAWSWTLGDARLDDGAYELVVRAEDARGEWGEARVPFHLGASRSRAGDITLEVLTPAPESRVGGILRVEGAAYHPAGLDHVRVRLDEGPWQPARLEAATWVAHVDTRGVHGAANLTVQAFHGGVVNRTLEVPLQIHNPAPRIRWVTELPDPFLGNATARVGLAGDASVARVQWRVDAHPWRDAFHDGHGWAFVLDAGDYANGTHLLQVRAESGTGIQSAVHNASFRSLRNLPDTPGETPAPPVAREAPGLDLGALALVGLGVAALRRNFGAHPPKT